MKSWENYAILVILVSFGVYAAITYGSTNHKSNVPPALTFMVSSGTVTNFTPCGCHSGKWGGLPRRGTIFRQAAESVTWPSLFIDTGDVTQGSTSDIQKQKDNYIFQAYDIMDYDVVNVGYGELGLGYEELTRIGQENNIHWISANTFGPNIFPDLPVITPPATGVPPATPPAASPPPVDAQPLFPPYIIVEPEGYPGFKIAFLGVMMQDSARLNPKRDTFSFEPYEVTIPRYVRTLRDDENVNLIVLLCDNDNFQNINTDTAFAGVDLVIGGQNTVEQSPNAQFNPRNPLYRPTTQIPVNTSGESTALVPTDGSETETASDSSSELAPLTTPILMKKGQGRGRLVLRLDLYFNTDGQIIDYYTDDIQVDDTFEDDPAMAEVARGYDSDVLAVELMARVERNFSGSEACDACHPRFNDAWANRGHFSSYKTIETEAALDDRSCTQCHAIGFVEEPRLLTYDLIDESHRNVGCEGCHPNGKRHITLQTQLANLSPEARASSTTQDTMDTSTINATTCTQCHTGEWGTGFNYNQAFEDAKAICTSITPSYVPPKDEE